jgi:regulator of sigma E protease
LDFELIAGVSWFLEPGNWPIALAVAAGIGMVIFVHELGHFAVAKWCGVKCEKFYLGFDIGGWKLFKFQWGETEYGVGILPLGGYVKMLGQEDNPQRMQEEFEKSKIRSEDGGTAAQGESGEEFVLDPRSYLAKSVPQRMAIISAGVIMNVIFCWVVSSMAYGLGVEQIACVVGHQEHLNGVTADADGYRLSPVFQTSFLLTRRRNPLGAFAYKLLQR